MVKDFSLFGVARQPGISASILGLLLAIHQPAPLFADPPALEPFLEEPPCQILLLGTFHFSNPGLDSYKPEHDIDIFSERRQAELREVLDRLEGFRPTKIAVEAKPENQKALDEKYRAYLEGEHELSSNEIEQIGYRLARRLGHERVWAVDAERRFYEPWVDPDEYAAEHGQTEVSKDPWPDRYEALYRYEDRLKLEQSLGEHLLFLNRPDVARWHAGRYFVESFKAGVGDDYPGVDSKIAWYNRNLRIFANLLRIKEREDERILLVIGSGHLGILRHAVESSPECRLVELEEYLGGSDDESKDEPPPRDGEGASPGGATTTFDPRSLVAEHTFLLSLQNGELKGAGVDFLLREASGARYVLLGEPHNTNEVNRFTAALFALLHERLGFSYLAVEQGPLIMDRYGSPPFRGDLDAIRRDVAAGNHQALHFATDAELALLAEVGSLSNAVESPVWGVDRTLSATLALTELHDALEDPEAKEQTRAVLRQAAAHETRMEAEHGLEEARAHRFMGAESDELDELLAGLDLPPGSRAAAILGQILTSRRDLRRYQTEHPPNHPWGYLSNFDREELMKRNFASRLQSARQRGEVPKVLVKAGHWHMAQGHNRGSVVTLGTALDGSADLAGSDTLSLAITVVNEPGQHWTITDYEDFAFIHHVADPAAWKIVDLRPLRPYAHAGVLNLSPAAEEYVFGFDALLVLGDTQRGTYTWRDDGSGKRRSGKT
jgi:hypothetical protein